MAELRVLSKSVITLLDFLEIDLLTNMYTNTSVAFSNALQRSADGPSGFFAIGYDHVADFGVRVE